MTNNLTRWIPGTFFFHNRDSHWQDVVNNGGQTNMNDIRSDWPEQDQMMKYAAMAKQFMNKPFSNPNDIVGNYEWHEQFPYEEGLMPKTEQPIEIALDFGCGTGRMIKRMKKLIKRVDGADISSFALEYAASILPDSQFYETSGIDLGATPPDTYDLIYSTISFQHIASRTIRDNILSHMAYSLKKGGYVSIQMAYHPTYVGQRWSHDTVHTTYNNDFWNAEGTNGHSDYSLNANDLPMLQLDFEKYFENIRINLIDVSQKYANLNGAYHAPYWPTDWLFIQGQKK